MPADDETAQQWLAQIEERERAETEASAALAAGPIAKTRRHGRSLGELLRGSRQQPRAPKPAKRAEHPLAAPSEPEPPAPPPTTRATPDVIFPSEEMGEGTPKIHPEELQVGAILTRSLVLASVVIGVVLLILLFLGG